MQTSYHSVRTTHGTIDYTLKRIRRTRFKVRVGYDGVVVHANLSEPISTAERYLRQFAQWFINKLAEIEASRPPSLNHWELGKTIRYLARTIELRQHFTHDTPLFMGEVNAPQDGDILLVDNILYPHHGVSIQDSCEFWLKRQAYQWFEHRLAWFYQTTGRKPHAFRLSKALQSWGQCNSKGIIGLNWRLIHLPPEQIDYVIAHELAHLKHMNHSKAFWQEVATIMPNYEPHKKAIKQQSLHTLT